MLRKIVLAGKYFFLLAIFFSSSLLFGAEQKDYSHYEKALKLYTNHEIWIEAIDEAKLQIAETPGHMKSYLLMSQIYLEFGEYAKAVEIMLLAVAKDPQNPEVTKFMNKILPAWEKSRPSSDDLSELYLTLAHAYAQPKSYGKAIEYYKKYLQVKPQDYKIRLEYARTLSWAKYYAASAEEYQKYLKKNPQERKIMMELANVYYWKFDLFSAEQELKKILLIDPRNIEALLLLGIMNEQQSRFAKAKGQYLQVLEISKNNKQAKDGLERIRKLEARVEEQRTSAGMKKYIEETKDYTLYLTLANQLYYEKGPTDEEAGTNKEDALKYYRLYLEKYPEDYETKLRFAEILSWERQYEESLSLYREYLAKYPAEHQIRLDMVKILTWKNDYLPALKELDIIQAVEPSFSDVYLVRANIYQSKGEYNKALDNYKLVMTLPYNLYNQEAIAGILEIERYLGIERRAMPALYLRYLDLRESVYGFHKTGFDMGGRVNMFNGKMTLNAGYKQYLLEQTDISSMQARETYVAGDGVLQENWRGSAMLSFLQLYDAERVNITLGTVVKISPETTFTGTYCNGSGLFGTFGS